MGASGSPGWSGVRGRAAGAFARLDPALGERAAATLPPRDAAALRARVERRWLDAYEPLERLYGGATPLHALLDDLLGRVLEAAAQRCEALRELDHRREIVPDWYASQGMVGYVCYAHRFAGSLADVARRLDYLAELGVTYLHLMPLLRARAGPADGGYAVVDYRNVDPALGTNDDLRALAADLRQRRMSLCVDLVCNHTAREHEWARGAVAGERDYRDYYHLFADRDMPDRYEATLPEVFPDVAPGNFSWVGELDSWVWTTFYDYQWDLNYANPRVFAEMLDVMCHLANLGVEVLRLDAVPFLWKREGTNCQNQPEVHWLLQAFRALVGMAAPAVAFKAEAIVGPEELVKYLGAHDRHRPECEITYHNQLMVMGWSSLAARDVRLATHALSRMRTPPPHTTWATYVRCHDDIGWAVTDEDAAAVGLSGMAHRRFLADFYAGRFPFSFAEGALFQDNPETGDARTSGNAAALCGITQALRLGDEALLEQAVRRLLLLYGLAFGFGGTPLVYMGDELALGNDTSYLSDPSRAGDNRWLHRPVMDWAAASRRHDPATVEGRVFAGLQHLSAVRRELPALGAGGHTQVLWTDNPRVLAWRRLHPRAGVLLGLASFSDVAETCSSVLLQAAGLASCVDALAEDAPPLADDRLSLPPLGVRWLVEPEAQPSSGSSSRASELMQ